MVDVEGHRRLRRRRHLGVEAGDGLPQLAEGKDLARDGVGAGDVGRRHAGLFHELGDEGAADPVDHGIGDTGGDDLAAQPVPRDTGLEFVLNRPREIGDQVLGQLGIVGQVGVQDLVIQPDFAVGHEHGDFRPGQPDFVLGPLFQGFVVGHELHRPVQPPRPFQHAHQAHLVVEDIDALGLNQAHRLGLQIVVGQHEFGHFVGHPGQQRVPLFFGQLAFGDRRIEKDLDVDLVVGTVDAARIVDGIRVQAPARQGVFDAGALGHAEVGPFADDAAAQARPVDTDGVVGAVANVGVGFVGRLDVGADAAEPEQVHLGAEQRPDQLVGGYLVLGNAEAFFDWGRQFQGLGAALEDGAAPGQQLAIVVAPARARQREQPFALGEAFGRIRVGVDEDVQVIECRHQLDVGRKQHAVAEHVARHVADSKHREVVGLGVGTHLAEVPFHRFPDAAGGDSHLLVVVALAAARGEGVAEPEAVVGGHLVGDVGKGGRALVRGDHQVGVVVVAAHHVPGRHHLGPFQVVGDVEHAENEGLVAGDAFVLERLPVAAGRRPLDDEAALRAHRHDDGVLDLLRLDQAQDLGAEVLAPVGPAKAAARHLSEAQMDPFHARAVDEDLAQGPG